MTAKIATWRGGLTIVSDAAGKPMLWIDGEGGLHDELGPVKLYQTPSNVTVGELAVFVAEWVLCASERGGKVAYRDIHPDLRKLIYGLVPSVILVTDEDGVDFILS